LVPFGVGPGTLFFTLASSESDDSESELALDSPSDLEDGGDDFDVGVVTLDLASTFGFEGRGLFGGEETTFTPERLLLDCRELVSESASEMNFVTAKERILREPDSELDSSELESESSEAALGAREPTKR